MGVNTQWLTLCQSVFYNVFLTFEMTLKTTFPNPKFRILTSHYPPITHI